MMFSSQSTGSILLAAGLLFKIAQAEELIGYRAASEEEAKYINDEHRPHKQAKFDEGTLTQLGAGLHIVNSPASLSDAPGTWYCAFKAEISEMKDLDKVWIPIKNPQNEAPLWFSSEETIMTYVNSLIDDDADEALRLAYTSVANNPNELEMLLPIETLGDDDLDLWGECWRTKAEMQGKFNEIVDWKSWGNIAGNPGPLSPSRDLRALPRKLRA
ncbi:uncharacterized protein L3040_001610 [Drepanopeziza brunnea f. sp. 'multigermtubi']|uniref:uncharacterized protein n=1 Tax=Drepanopeziza brunnea f. sp. 'multigermtubi' TaxID=698441 RepID=UPI002399A662|nr:hypothetical protein L3040_001610 [Drepanopeziza brunnea f. sp. 'multigermtubi']